MSRAAVSMPTPFPPSIRQRRAKWPIGRLSILASSIVVLLSSSVVALGESALRGVYLLPVGNNRASVVVELETAGGQAKIVDIKDAGSFVVDIGPLPGPVDARVLRAAPSAPLVREVVVRGMSGSSHETVARVQVGLRSPAAGSLRVAGRRIYIDFAPENTRSPVTPAAPLSQPPPIVSRVESDEDVLAQARDLASVPNVKGLADLKARVIRLRGSQKPQAGAETGDQLLARIDTYLVEAQKLQLAKDAQLFQRAPQSGSYRSTLQRAVSDLDAIDTAFQPDIDAATLTRLQIEAVQLANRLQSISAPSELATAHRQLSDATAALAAALAQVTVGDEGSAAPVRAAVARARAALMTTLEAAPPERSSQPDSVPRTE
jgi:hypothetical protein